MDTKTLSQAIVVIWGACLPYVFHGNPPATGEPQMWEAVANLWQAMRLALGSQPGGGTALNVAVERPSGANLARLSKILIDVLEADHDLRSQVETILDASPFAAITSAIDGNLSETELEQQCNELRQQTVEMREDTVDTASRTVNPIQTPIACQTCGRQDSSLRVVVYPYVMSVVVMTFRRSFAGVWCWRHALQWRIIASAITAGIGWVGIPFGLIFAPIALLKLAQGGDQPIDVNQRMLINLAEHKLKSNSDPGEAIRCYEAALAFGTTPAIEARLRELYGRNADTSRTASVPALAAIPLLLAGAALIGLAVGLLDYGYTAIFSALGNNLPFVIAMLTWSPLVVFLFAGGLLLSQLVESILTRSRIHQASLGVAAAVFASVLAIYMESSAREIAYTIFVVPLDETFSTIQRGIITLAIALVWGGAGAIRQQFNPGNTSSMIYLLITVVMGGIYLVSTMSVARRVTRRVKLANELRGPAAGGSAPSMATGWLAIVGSALVFGALFPAMIFASQFQYGNPAAMELVSQGFTEYKDGNAAGAKAKFEEAKAIDPNSFAPYLGLGYTDVDDGNCEQALVDGEKARGLAPRQAKNVAYAIIGESQACLFHIDESIAALEQGFAFEPGSREGLTKLGLLYLLKGDFKKAEDYFTQATEKDSAWAAAHFALALAYYDTDDTDEEQAALKQGLALTVDDLWEYSLIARYYYEKNNFAESEKYLRKALALRPDDPNVLMTLAGILTMTKKYDEAFELTGKILERPTNYYYAEAHVVTSTVYVEQEDLDSALAELEQAEKLEAKNPGVHGDKAFIFYYQKKYQAAIDEANLSLAEAKYSVLSISTLALAQQALGKQEEAVASAQRAIDIAPKSDLPYYVMGVYSMEKGDKAAAIKAFKTFLALTTDRAYVRELAMQARAYLAALTQP